MKSLPLLIVALLMAACSSPLRVRPAATFTGDYLDSRKDPATKGVVAHKTPLRVPAYLEGREIDASAVVAFMVEKDGRTSEVQIVRTTDDAFAEAVRASVSGWRYTPFLKDGAPVRVVVQETVSWKPQFPKGP